MAKFGKVFDNTWPELDMILKLTDFGRNLLKKCEFIANVPKVAVDLNDFLEKSNNFQVPFPVDTCRVKSQPCERVDIIKEEISSAYPIIHERVLGLYLAFLEHKNKYGNSIELRIYENLNITEFVQRLLTKRPAAFTDEQDNYVLLTGEMGAGGFSKIGTDRERPPFILENLQSYDEMKLSAFLSVSSHTDFINDGRRDNMAKIEYTSKQITRDGIVIGLIGGRFQRIDKMESEDILITPRQNTKANGYGFEKSSTMCINSLRRLWNEFYEENDFLYENINNNMECGRFSDEIAILSEKVDYFFDYLVMKKRYTISIDTLLLEAEARAASAHKYAYVHVVGIGLGVWRATRNQEEIFLKTFEQRLRVFVPQLRHIGILDFSWFHLNECGDLMNGAVFTSDTQHRTNIRILFSKRNPSAKLPLGSENMLLVVSYAWDSNSMPGNEFWANCLSNSSDSSNASSSLVTELHNPYINTDFVNGANLHIATLNHGVMHIHNYCRNVLKLF